MKSKYDESVSRCLTVVLAVKNRPNHTLRWLEYAERVNFPFRVLIADGSGEGKLEKRIQRVAATGRVRITYRRFPYDATFVRFYGKMVSALGCCETPYCALVENDTLPVPQGLYLSLKFLIKHSEYSTCRGQYVDFRLESGREDPLPLQGQKIYVQNAYFNRQHSIWKSFEQAEPLDRLKEWSRAMCIMYNNVHRAGTLSEGFQFLKRNKVSDIIMCDIIFSLMALSVGKSKILDEPYMLSQQNSPDGVSVASRRKANIFERMFTPDWTRNVARLAHFVAERLPSGDAATRRGAEQEVLSCLIRHYADRVHSHLHKHFVEEQKEKASGITEGDYVFRLSGKQRGFRSRWKDQFRFLLGERHA